MNTGVQVLAVGVAGLALGLGLGYAGGGAGEPRAVVPPSCLAALEAGERGFGVTAQLLAAVRDSDAQQMVRLEPLLSDASDDWSVEKTTCRAAAR